MAKDEVEKVEVGAGSIVPAAMDFEADAGIGQEGMGKDDLAIPRLVILQALSPQLQKQKSEFIEGADQGQIFDTVSKALYEGDKGLTVVPICYRRAYLEWKLREDGGGFVKDHSDDESILQTTKKDKRGRDMTEAGTQIVTTAEYFVMQLLDDGSFIPAVISMASTQLKKARNWNTLMKQWRMPSKAGGTYNPPMFARSYEFTTVPESNDQGSWFGWSIKPGKTLEEIEGGAEIYMAARDFYEKIKAGSVKVSAHNEDVASVEESDDDPM